MPRITGQDIPLAWESQDLPGVSAIEVYPAGTLLAHGLPAAGYKKPAQRQVRSDILAGIGDLLVLPEGRESILNDADCLDAVLCILAAIDFLEGNAVPPINPSLAKKEGWIWVRRELN